MISEQNYRLIVENTNDLVLILDKNNKIEYVNERAHFNSMGYKKEDLIGVNGMKFVHPDDLKIAMDTIARGLETGEEKAVIRIKHKDGDYIWQEFKGVTYKDNDGITKIILIARDISERKKVESKLKKSKDKLKKTLETAESHYNFIYETAPAGLWAATFHNGVFIRANQKTAEILGFKNVDEVVNKVGVGDFFNQEQRNDFIKLLKEKGEITSYESHFIDVEGKEKYISVSAKIFKDSGILEGVFIDISEIKSAQKALNESHNMLQLVMNNIPQNIFWKNTDLEYMGCNLAFAQSAGVEDPEDIIGKTDYDLAWTKEEAEYFREVDKRVMESDTSEYYIIEPVTQSDGKQRWADTNKIPIHDSDDKVVGILGMYEDITEKMETEDKIEESEAKFKLITEQSLMAIMIIQDNLVKYVNQAGVEMIGVSAEEMKSWSAGNFIKFVHPEDRTVVMEQALKKQKGQKDVLNHYHYRVLRGGKEPRWIDNYSKTIQYRGKPADLITAIDITERFEAEQLVSESEEQLRTTIDSLGDALHVIDRNYNIILMNFSFIRWLDDIGLDTQLVGRNVFEAFPFLSDFSKKEYEQVFETGGSNLMIETSKIGGKNFITETRKIPVVKDGEVFQIITVVRDITEQREVEKQLKESEEQLRLISSAVEQTTEGVAISDLDGNLLYLNRAFANIHGYEPEELLGKHLSIFHTLEQLPEVEKLNLQIQKEGWFSGEVWHKKRDNTVFPTIMNNSVLRDDKGVPIGMIATALDTTEMKEAERRLEESEEKYRTLIENSPDFIFIIDTEERLVFENRFQPGFTAEEVIGRPIYDFIVPESRPIHKLAIRKVFQTGEPEEIVVQAKGPQGLPSWYEDRLIPIEKDGEVDSIMFIAKEITDMKVAQERLRESEARYRTILENMNEGYFEVDLAGTFTFYNKAFSEILGFSSNELIGKNYADLLDKKNAQKVYTHYNSVYNSTAETNTLEYEAFKKNGEKIYIDTSAYARYDTEGKVTGFYGIGRDITERKKAALIIEQENINLKAIDQIRKDLISRVSHELKTPLIPICGGAELLLHAYKDQLGEESLDIIKLIEKGGNRLKELVEKLLDISRIEFNKLELEKKDINLSELVKGCLANLKYTVNTRKLNIDLKIPDSLIIKLDEIRIEQVVTNLLTNAIKNTPPEGIIEINIETYQNLAILSVKDTGVGLTDEEMKNLFTRFGKIERYGDDLDFIDIQGSGLGLYISKQIVDLHDGKIWADSEGRHKGAAFTVRLPIK